MHRPAYLRPFELIGAISFWLEHGIVAVIEIDDLARQRDDRGSVGTRKHFTVLPDADQQRRAVSSHDDLVRVPARDDGDAVGPVDRAKRGGDSILHGHAVRPQMIDQMDDYFRVGL